jgi:hypothetical protein
VGDDDEADAEGAAGKVEADVGDRAGPAGEEGLAELVRGGDGEDDGEAEERRARE